MASRNDEGGEAPEIVTTLKRLAMTKEKKGVLIARQQIIKLFIALWQ